MADIAERFEANPLLKPADIQPSMDGLVVKCVFNPGAFRYGGRTGLLLRIAEFAPSDEHHVRVPIVDHSQDVQVLEFDRSQIGNAGPCTFEVGGKAYLTSLSHLRLAWSDDGVHFEVDRKPTLLGIGDLETYGIEDCRVVRIGDVYHLTYSQVSPHGVGVGLATTTDWKRFERRGMIIPPHNKDCALFPRKIDGQYVCLHRPSGAGIGGNYIWLARSTDLIHWGEHQCVAHSRDGQWDSARIGAGAEPIETADGWLCIYHGVSNGRYCLGGLLLDKHDPSRVIARSAEPIMEPTADYEAHGFVNAVVFTNGQIVDGDTVTIYYGGADTVTCGATMSMRKILAGLR